MEIFYHFKTKSLLVTIPPDTVSIAIFAFGTTLIKMTIENNGGAEKIAPENILENLSAARKDAPTVLFFGRGDIRFALGFLENFIQFIPEEKDKELLESLLQKVAALR